MKKAQNLSAGDIILVDGAARRIALMHKQLEGGQVRITLEGGARIECQWDRRFKLA